ncbi:MAG TPA: prolipoprotein diacylglyceryl transferase [Syntrophorhabdaceae bacterium]|nr:prolipoprotein diacylglyceryl transferase [Syntrophorhabdaceae bacterium]
MIFNKGPFVLNIDPAFAEVWGVKLWYYGLAYALGFFGMFLWVMLRRRSLGLSTGQVWDFSIIFSLSSLIGGRVFEIIVYEWGLFRPDPLEALAFWHGGMASHGVILGALCGIVLFCVIHKKRFLVIADDIVIPAALFLALGRIGNHINGEVYGYVTGVWWAVKFPYAEGFRHPVALYDALKNLFLIPILVSVGKNSIPGQGRMLGNFIFWYGLLRIIVDYYRDYGSLFLGVGTGQYYNALMAVVGLLLIARSARKDPKKKTDLNTLRFAPAALIARLPSGVNSAVFFRAILFFVILAFCLTIPSGWSQQWLHDLIARNGI